MKFSLQTVIWTFVLYLIAILLYGYQFAISDQVEILPILDLWSSESALFTKDFYVQSFLEKTVTERTPYLWFLNATTNGSALGIFVLHAIFSLTFYAGLLRLGEWISGSLKVSVLLSLAFLMTYSLSNFGGNELYYNYLIPSLPAKSLGIWAILFWLKKEKLLANALLACATLFQPLVGLQLFLILTLVDVYETRDLKGIFIQCLPFLLVACPWILLLLNQQSHDALSNSQYLEILEFRVGHHFFPQYNGFVHVLLFSLIAVFALKYFHRANRSIAYFILLGILGILIYSLSIIFFPVTTIINSQWYKITIWIELFGIWSAILWAIGKFNLDIEKYFIPLMIAFWICLGGLLMSGVKSPPKDFPWQPLTGQEYELGMWVKDNTSENALFLVPPSFSRFKIISQRSSFVDFKTMIHHHDYMAEFYQRVHMAYHIDLMDRQYLGLTGMLEKANGQLQTLPVDVLTEMGVTHLIRKWDKDLTSNQGKIIYHQRRQNGETEYVVIQVGN